MTRPWEVSQYGRFGNNNNLLINGNFGIWQRAVSQTVTGYGSADRFKFDVQGATQSIVQGTFTPGTSAPDTDPRLYPIITIANSVNSTDYSLVQQRVEDVRKTAGKKLTFSFWAKTTAAATLAIEFSQLFGTAGSVNVYTACGTVTTTADTWEKHTVTFDAPSISGKTVGTGSSAGIVIWQSAGSAHAVRAQGIGHQNTVFRYSGWKLESGGVATPFINRPYEEELALCQRYYEKRTGAVGLFHTHYGNDTTGVFASERSLMVEYAVVKRDQPTIAHVTSPAGGASVYHNTPAGATFLSSGVASSTLLILVSMSADAEL